jgi:molybdenum cofactor cytidylyltransferase
VRASKPTTGHCNLLATADGLLETDPALINHFNRIDPEIKLATAPHWALRKSGAIMARIKVIPFAVARERLDHLLQQVQAWQLQVGVAALRQFNCTLVMTQLPGTEEARLTQTVEGIGQRLQQVNNRITHTVRCAHTLRGISEALTDAVSKQPELVLVASASATVDLVDVSPCAIEEAGGRIIQYGFPLEPGSLLVMAAVGGVPVLVLPGCARSAKPNGIDRLLQRFAADRMPTAEEMLDWGCGGLLPGQKA